MQRLESQNKNIHNLKSAMINKYMGIPHIELKFTFTNAYNLFEFPINIH